MSNLYLVYVRDPVPDADSIQDAVELDDGLFLVHTTQTRSQLYHAIKRRLLPRQLLVAPLSGLPKFKGMRKGATKQANRMDVSFEEEGRSELSTKLRLHRV